MSVAACGGSSTGANNSSAAAAAAAASRASASGFVEGQDYIVLERRRFLDETRFDQPVEAFSMLFPRGWTVTGGVKWRGIGECRGDIVSNEVKASSADGAIQYQAFPSRSFSFSDDQFMMQALQAGAQAGRCAINPPFDAVRYVSGFAQRDLQATANDVRLDEERMTLARQLDEQANATSRQFGNPLQQQTTFAYGKLSWPNGDEGILHVGVTNMVNRKPNMVTGSVSTDSTTSVFYCVMMRFPAAKRDEGTKLFGTVQTSFRQNPIWKQAKEQFLTQLGNIEHAGRMETLRLMGEQARAYAKSRSAAQDQQLRDWESQQASQDRQHTAFVQTIREVETWKDSSGTSVELSSGYHQAWSRGDGSYILSNKPTFDPSSVFQDQR
jgi:hypothetical protein